MTLAAPDPGESASEHSEASALPLRRIDRARLSGGAVPTARALLGALIVRDDRGGRRVGRIVETEAYDGPRDRASHARAGRTARTSVMFGPAGHAYVYFVYGMHHCLNVVCGVDGEAAAVLIRAMEPLVGIEAMRDRRGATAGPDHRLTAGPARTCQALDIDRTDSGLDLVTDQRLWLAVGDPTGDEEIASGPRIGVDYAGPEWAGRPWRFGVSGNPSLSRPFPVDG